MKVPFSEMGALAAADSHGLQRGRVKFAVLTGLPLRCHVAFGQTGVGLTGCSRDCGSRGTMGRGHPWRHEEGGGGSSRVPCLHAWQACWLAGDSRPACCAYSTFPNDQRCGLSRLGVVQPLLQRKVPWNLFS